MRPVPSPRQRLLAFCASGLLAAAWAPVQASDDPQAPPSPELKDAIETGMGQLNLLLGRGTPDSSAISELLASTVDISEATRRAFGDYVNRVLRDHDQFYSSRELAALAVSHQRRLEESFERRLIADLASYLQTSEMGSFESMGLRVAGNRATLSVNGPGTQGRAGLDFHLHQSSEGWRLRDAKIGGRLLSQGYRSQYRTILKLDYSLPVLEAQLEDREYVSLEDFSTTAPGEFPTGWGWWRSKDDDKVKLYEVQVTGDRHYLAAQDTGSSVILLKYVHWNPREYPILTWCWRATSLPPGGNERVNHLNDSAAGVYAMFSKNWLGIPQQIKYVWSTTLPVGTVDRRKKFARPYFFVVESGTDQLGRWTFEQVDLHENFTRVYGGKPNRRSLGIGVLTDGNNTDAHVAADYADLRVWTREAQASDRIPDYCECLEETR